MRLRRTRIAGASRARVGGDHDVGLWGVSWWFAPFFVEEFCLVVLLPCALPVAAGRAAHLFRPSGKEVSNWVLRRFYGRKRVRNYFSIGKQH